MADFLPEHVVVASGLYQLAFAVLLGWPLTAMYAGVAKVGPIRDRQRLLQCHLDNIFMGVIQVAVGVAHSGINSILGFIFIAASWTNPQGFLIRAIYPEVPLTQKGLMAFGLLATVLATIAYPWLALSYTW